MNEKYLKVIEILGEAIINNELKNSVLEYENKSLKKQIESFENYYKDLCENVNK